MPDDCPPAQATRPVARFAVLDSGIHGRGAFAMRGIGSGETLVEYTGELIPKSESAKRCAAGNPFIFAIDDHWDLDGDHPDNPARFLNHSCSPNCEAVLRGGQVWILALRDLRPGEELTFDYGYDIEDYRDHPCRCGASGCCGYVVAEPLRDQVRELEAGTQRRK